MPPSKKPKNAESFVKEPQICSIQFKCPKCDFSSTSANSLTQHIRTTHPVVEDFDLITVNNLSMVKKEQELSENVWSCEYCDETFDEKEQVNKHQDSTHQLTEIIYPLPHGWKKNCCKRRNNASKDWNVYVISPDGETLQSSAEIEEYLSWNPQVKCDKSVTNTDLPSNLENISMRENVWSCQYCDETFYEIVELNKHRDSTHKQTEIIYPLPYGWKKNCRKRRNNASKGWNVHVTSPDGKMLRSCGEIEEYLTKNPEVKCDKTVTNTRLPNNVRYLPKKTCPSDDSEKLTEYLKKLSEHVWSCQYCDETFYKKVELKKHQDSNHQLTEIIYPLTYGWKKVCHKRRNNFSKDWNVYVASPDGKMLQSCDEINKYLDENPEVKCDKNVTNTDQPSNLENIRDTKYTATKSCTSDNSEKLSESDLIVMKEEQESIKIYLNPEVKCDKTVTNTILPSNSENISSKRYIATKTCTSNNSEKQTDFDSIVVKEEQDSIKVGNVFSFEDPIVEDSIRELMKSVKTEAQDTDDSEKMKKIDTINVKDEIIIQNRDKSVTDGKTRVILEQRIMPENDETIHEGKYPGNLYVQEKYLPQLLPNKKVRDEKDLDKHYRDPSCKKDQNILAIHEKTKPFVCDICHAYFVIKASLTKHIKKVHDEDEPESIFGI